MIATGRRNAKRIKHHPRAGVMLLMTESGHYIREFLPENSPIWAIWTVKSMHGLALRVGPAGLMAFRIDTLSVCAINISIRQTFALSKENVMKTTAPKEITFWISVVIGVLALLSKSGTLADLPIEDFWLLFIGFVVLVLGVLVKRM
jgi:hypothetical protein